jgi:hypothetical protein
MPQKELADLVSSFLQFDGTCKGVVYFLLLWVQVIAWKR